MAPCGKKVKNAGFGHQPTVCEGRRAKNKKGEGIISFTLL